MCLFSYVGTITERFHSDGNCASSHSRLHNPCITDNSSSIRRLMLKWLPASCQTGGDVPRPSHQIHASWTEREFPHRMVSEMFTGRIDPRIGSGGVASKNIEVCFLYGLQFKKNETRYIVLFCGSLCILLVHVTFTWPFIFEYKFNLTTWKILVLLENPTFRVIMIWSGRVWSRQYFACNRRIGNLAGRVESGQRKWTRGHLWMI